MELVSIFIKFFCMNWMNHLLEGLVILGPQQAVGRNVDFFLVAEHHDILGCLGSLRHVVH